MICVKVVNIADVRMNMAKSARRKFDTEINMNPSRESALPTDSETVVSGEKNAVKFKDGIYIYADTVSAWRKKSIRPIYPYITLFR